MSRAVPYWRRLGPLAFASHCSPFKKRRVQRQHLLLCGYQARKLGESHPRLHANGQVLGIVLQYLVHPCGADQQIRFAGSSKPRRFRSAAFDAYPPAAFPSLFQSRRKFLRIFR